MIVSGKTVFIASLLTLAGALAAPETALAVRKVNFAASAQTKIYDNQVQGTTRSECRIMIQNFGSTSQSVTLYFSGTANGSNAGTVQSKLLNGVATALANPFTDTVTLTAGTMIEYGMLMPTIAKNTVATQEIVCSGYITADDSTAGQSGFITATGSITSFQESAPGAGLGAGDGTSNVVTTSPHTEVIVIGEGRPI